MLTFGRKGNKMGKHTEKQIEILKELGLAHLIEGLTPAEKKELIDSSKPLLPADGNNIELGDTLRIKDTRKNNNCGTRSYKVVRVDNHCFAVLDIDTLWWWHKDLTPYMGSAVILGILK